MGGWRGGEEGEGVRMSLLRALLKVFPFFRSFLFCFLFVCCFVVVL